MDGPSGAELGITTGSDARVDTSGFGEPVKKAITEVPNEEAEHPSKFSEETRKKLQEKGYRIFTLNGDTLSYGQLVQFVNPFLVSEDSSLIAQNHMQNSEVALAPFRILEESKDGTFDEQNDLIKQYANEIGNEFPGATAIIGEIADYVALEAEYKRNNPGKSLFKDGFIRSRTFIQKGEKNEKNFFLAEGDAVSYCDPNFKFEGMYAAPLIVPSRT